MPFNPLLKLGKKLMRNRAFIVLISLLAASLAFSAGRL
jgi:hypothetical protein